MSTRFAVTLDPLHIGTGGYRLGRVDNTIVRDAGSGLPKVPGSSLAGVARSYLLQVLEGEEAKKAMACAAAEGNDKGNCGSCMVCRLFGYAASANQKKSHIGLFHFYDGDIVAFPVSTIAGPVWVTSPSAVALAAPDMAVPKMTEDLLLVDGPLPEKLKKLNAGWLYLDVRRDKEVFKPLRSAIGASADLFARLALAPDWLFAELVNSNLEVRTSVSIDPLTGAAEAGKLFTYEAIPAATLLAFDIGIDVARCRHGDAEGEATMDPDEAMKLLDKALELCGVLGMGGMVTRGFGRVRFLGGA